MEGVVSDRGSFVTEFIYCKDCLKAARKVLIGEDKYLCSEQIKELPIIAGKIGALNDCVLEFGMHYVPDLEKVICHPLRVGVIGDGFSEAKLFTINPTKELEVQP